MSNNNRRFVSAREVAALAGVSRSQVSRTFTEGASVSPATRQKVIAAARELGYHVNLLARGLHDSSHIVSLLTTDINTPYQAEFIDLLTRQLQAIHKVALVINTKDDSDSVSRALTQTLNFRAEASIILSGQPHQSLIQQCLNNGQRVILVNRNEHCAGAEHILLDNRQAAEQACSLLYDNGCRNLAVINADIDSSSRMSREQAFVIRARQLGVDVRVVRHGKSCYNSGAAIAEQLLGQPNAVNGVFCVTDLLACGFMDAARDRFGIHIPDQLAVIGFDNIQQAGWSAYQLTTFRQPLQQIVQDIIHRLQSPANTQLSDSCYALEPVRRQSC